MPRIELEVDDKGEFVGQLPAEVDAILKRVEASAHGQGYGKGVAKAAEDAKKQIEDNVKAEVARLNALAPLEKEKYSRIDEENTSLKTQVLELAREHDRSLKSREENHARELLDRAEALKKRNARIVDLTKGQLRVEARAAGARDESAEELEVILHTSVGYNDDMEPFVKNPDGSQKLVHGKPQSLAAFVKEYLDTHPHHRKAPAGQGGGARGGATLHGAAHPPASIESARARIDGGDRSLDAINDMFQAGRRKTAP